MAITEMNVFHLSEQIASKSKQATHIAITLSRLDSPLVKLETRHLH